VPGWVSEELSSKYTIEPSIYEPLQIKLTWT
jgi:hypothetical protein